MHVNKPYLICLTGGIASGKTTVSDEMGRLGLEIIDTDVLARVVVARGSEGLDSLVSVFGASILNKDASLNRMQLRKQVFSDSKMMIQLNAIVHPLIHIKVLNLINKSQSKVIVVVIPLYSEQENYSFFDRVCSVDVGEESVQVNRLQQRDGIDKHLAEKMLKSQISRKERLTMADDVISNKKGVESLLHQVNNLVGSYNFFAEADNVTCQ